MNKQDLIDSFCLNYKGTDVAIFEKEFKKMCTDNQITKGEFEEWQRDFKMFIYENPSFVTGGGIGWERERLLELKL